MSVIIITIAAVVFILGSVLKAFGITLDKIIKSVKWFINLFRFDIKDKKSKAKTAKKVKKYAKKHDLSEDEVYQMVNNQIAIEKRKKESEKLAKENAKREKELASLIK